MKKNSHLYIDLFDHFFCIFKYNCFFRGWWLWFWRWNEDYRTGKELAYDGNYKAAIVYLKKSIRDDPNNPDAFNMLGFSNRKLGNNDEAFSYYNKALDLDPEHLGTHEYIGRLYLNLDQPEESKKHFRILKALCYFGCEELKSLEVAIKKYEMGRVSKKY